MNTLTQQQKFSVAYFAKDYCIGTSLAAKIMADANYDHMKAFTILATMVKNGEPVAFTK
jgi:hypothetical protein